MVMTTYRKRKLYPKLTHSNPESIIQDIEFIKLLEYKKITSSLKQIKLLVFDFDGTLTIQHTCHRIHRTIASQPNSLNTIIGFENAILFKEFIEYLLLNNKKVAIASYGIKTIILNQLNQIFGDDNPFNVSNIITPADIGWREGCCPPAGYNKVIMLDHLAFKFSCSKSEVILIDDDIRNVNEARTQQYKSIHVPSLKGWSHTYNSIKKARISSM